MKMKTRDLVLIALFTALTAVGAFLKIPTPLVPFTLQVLFCAYAGVLLGAKYGALSQILYVAVGLAGIPIFSEGGGLGYVFNPKFGYLLGFILCAYVIGRLTQRAQKLGFVRVFAASMAGLLAVYVIGVPYLYFMINRVAEAGKEISFSTALEWGFTPFVLFDVIKAAIVAFTAVKVIPILKRQGLLSSDR